MRPSISPEFISALLSWYDSNRRDLPWRDHPEPYAVLVSEFMLQQTTVPAVIPRFEQWIKDFPTIEILASEEPEAVLLKWEGLGYYSRARNLHLAAKEIVSSYGGKVPDAPADLKKLPGIGDYTAAAVASIAYGVRAAALDANNLRVWSRLLSSNDRKRITRVFNRVLPHDRPGDFNQALMDLGTSVCTSKNPACPVCPLIPWCRALRTETVSKFPKKKARPETERIEAAIGIILKDGKILVQKRPDTGLMAGLWEFPGGKLKTIETQRTPAVAKAMTGKLRNAEEGYNLGGRAVPLKAAGSASRKDAKHAKKILNKGEKAGPIKAALSHTETQSHRENRLLESPEEAVVREKGPGIGVSEYRRVGEERSIGVSGYRGVGENSSESPEAAVVREIREETGLRVQVCEKLGVFTHAYTKFRVKLHVFICKQKAGTVHNSTARWVTLEELEGLAMPSVNRRIVKALERRLDIKSAD